MEEVIFVCTGNTCRSPLAAELFSRKIIESDELQKSDFIISSAGISAFVGQPAAGHACEVAEKYGIDISSHRSQPLKKEMVASATLILTMTYQQAEQLREEYEEFRDKIYSITGFLGVSGDVIDPFAGDLEDYHQTFRQLNDLVEGIVNKLPEYLAQAGNIESTENKSIRSDTVKIAIGSDHAGFNLKEEVKNWLVEKGYQVTDAGTDSLESVDYPDFAQKTAAEVSQNNADLGILICGTGIGMAISANKVQGIKAARCQDTYSARMARAHNKANVLTMGARVIGSGLAIDVVETFLESEFAGGRHQRRVDKMTELEKEMSK